MAQDLNAKVRPVRQGAKERHLINLEGLFKKIAEYKLKPDPEKCVFGIEPGKFMGSLLTEHGMETNPERCMYVLSGFAPVGGRGDLPYQECKEAFIRLKEYLASPPVLCKPQPSTSFSLYLVVIDQAISSVLVQKQDQFQKLIRIVGRVRQGPEERHQVPKKAAPLVSRQVSPVWTGSFRVTEVLRNKACRLEMLKRGPIPRTWNAYGFKFYFS